MSRNLAIAESAVRQSRTIVRPAKPHRNAPEASSPLDGILILGSDPAEYGLATRVVTITPSLAQAWLGTKHDDQRRIKSKHLRSMMTDLREGRWRLNGETIVFDSNGKLVNGQHRLEAVVATGVTVTSLVVWGVASEAYSSFDMTAKRMGGDALRSRGVLNGAQTAAVCRSLMIYAGDPTFTDSPAFSADAIDQFERTHEGLAESVLMGKRVAKMQTSITGTVAGACHYLFSKIDADLASEFFESLISGVGLGKTDPVRLLRERALNRTWRPRAQEQFAYMFKAWNHFRHHTPIRCLKWDSRETFPTIKA